MKEGKGKAPEGAGNGSYHRSVPLKADMSAYEKLIKVKDLNPGDIEIILSSVKLNSVAEKARHKAIIEALQIILTKQQLEELNRNFPVLIAGPPGPTGKSSAAEALRALGYTVYEKCEMQEVYLDEPFDHLKAGEFRAILNRQ